MEDAISCNFMDVLGITSFDQLLMLEPRDFVEQNKLSFEQREIFASKLNELKTNSFKLKKWLQSKSLEEYISGFYKLGYTDLDSVRERMLRFEIKDVISRMDGSFSDYQLLVEAVDELKEGSNGWIIVSVFYFFFHALMFLFKWIRKYLCNDERVFPLLLVKNRRLWLYRCTDLVITIDPIEFVTIIKQANQLLCDINGCVRWHAFAICVANYKLQGHLKFVNSYFTFQSGCCCCYSVMRLITLF